MKRLTESILTDTAEMTAYYTELGRILSAAELHTFQEKTPCFQYVMNNVIVVNRCFYRTIGLNEPLISKSLLRLQLQNLVYLYAETKHPLKVIIPVYSKGKDFNKLGIQNFSDYLKELEPEYKGELYNLWADCCKYVHPSAINYTLSNTEYSLGALASVDPTKQKPEILKQIRLFQKEKADLNSSICFLDNIEMVSINRLIVKLAKKQITELEKQIKQNRKYYKRYKAFLEGGGKAIYL